MKCARCGVEGMNVTLDDCGILFIATKSEHTYDPGGILADPSLTIDYDGFELPWYVCEACTSKGHDRSGIIAAVVSVVLLGIGFFGVSGALMMMGLVGLLVSAYALTYWLKDEAYRSKYAKDRIFQESIHSLMAREDFVEAVGRIRLVEDLDPTMTRFQREIL